MSRTTSHCVCLRRRQRRSTAREIRHLAIIVNPEYDPTAAFRNQVVHFDFRKLDVFSFGEQQNCPVGSVDLLYRNSWNEVRTLHFNGEQAMIEALKTILGKMHQMPHPGQRGGVLLQPAPARPDSYPRAAAGV